MFEIVDNPVEMSFEDAIHAYEGSYIGVQVVDADETCIYSVKVMTRSDTIPDNDFLDISFKLKVNRIMRANPDGMLFPTREEMKAKHERSSL